MGCGASVAAPNTVTVGVAPAKPVTGKTPRPVTGGGPAGPMPVGGAAHSTNGGAAAPLTVGERMLIRYDDDVRAAQKKIRPHSWFNYMYAKYLPNMCRERFASDPAELKEAELERFEGVVAFVDISGFTKLSEYLVTKHGADSAAELLNKFISGYFEKLVEVVVLHGGDIIKFAGDAMLVVWRNKRPATANIVKPSTLPPPPPPGAKGTLAGALNAEMLKANNEKYSSVSELKGDPKPGTGPANGGSSTPELNHLASAALGMSMAALFAAGGGPMAGGIVNRNASISQASMPTPPLTAAAAPADPNLLGAASGLPPLSNSTPTGSPQVNSAFALTPQAAAGGGGEAAGFSLNKKSARSGSIVGNGPAGGATGTPTSAAAAAAAAVSPLDGARAMGLAPKITIDSPTHSAANPSAAAATAVANDAKAKALGANYLSGGPNEFGASGGVSPNNAAGGSQNGVMSPTAGTGGGFGSTPGGGEGGKRRTAHSRVASLAAMEKDRYQADSLSTMVLRATACNLVLLNRLNNYRAADSDDIRLTLHTGIACGEICGLYVGGVQGMWEFYVAGDPIKDMSDAAELAQSGEVVLSAKAHALIHAQCDASPKLPEVKPGAAPSGHAPPSPGPPCMHVRELRVTPRVHASLIPFISVAAEKSANAFIPPIVKNRIEAGQTASWLAEFRRVCIMFIALPEIKYDDPRVIAKIQEAVAVVQKEVLALEGNIARLLADDKGTRFKIAFGMPTMNHEDDAVRVVLAGIAIQTKLQRMQTATAIGIATGHVYCGEAGSSRRCEYTAVGYKVILAARLMQQAVGTIFCDEDTYTLASHAITFEDRPPIILKGIAKPVPVFRPHAPHSKNMGKAGKLIGVDANRPHGPGGAGGHTKVNPRDNIKSGSVSEAAGAKRPKEPSAAAAAGGDSKVDAKSGNGKDEKENSVGSGTRNPAGLGGLGREGSIVGSTTAHPHTGISAQAMANLPKGAQRRLSQMVLKKSFMSQSQSRLVPEVRIYGREKEREKLKTLLRQVTQEGHTQIVVIEGEGGVGKSVFINDFLYSAGELKVDMCYGAGESMEGRTPYFPWKSVFEEMLGLDSVKIVKRKNEKVAPFISAELSPLAALLNSFLGTGFDENDVTSNMPADARAKNMEKLLVEIMRAKRVRSPTANPAHSRGAADWLPRVIVMEDLHWVDSGTWNLAFDISRTVPNLLVVFTTRPMRAGTANATYTKITRLKNTTLLTLDLLSRDAMFKLACHKLGVHNIPAELFEMIQKKSGGLPLYIEEVIQSMLEFKIVRVEQGEVIWSKQESALPDSMQGVMVGRIDHLPAQEQLTLKVCSVIGAEVKLDLLRAVHPNLSTFPELTKVCNQLCDGGFLVPNNDQKGSYQFKHSYLVETAYNMLALAQRKDVHATITQYLETTYKHEISHFYVLLAHHASHAEQWSKALKYKELAGMSSMAMNANPEAADMFESAEDIMNKHGLKDVKRLQEIHINLGLVYFAIGRNEQAIGRLSQALAALNHPIPDGERKLTIELARVVMREYISPSFVIGAAEKAAAARAKKGLRSAAESSSESHANSPLSKPNAGGATATTLLPLTEDNGTSKPSTATGNGNGNGNGVTPIGGGISGGVRLTHGGSGGGTEMTRPAAAGSGAVSLPGTISEDGPKLDGLDSMTNGTGNGTAAGAGANSGLAFGTGNKYMTTLPGKKPHSARKYIAQPDSVKEEDSENEKPHTGTNAAHAAGGTAAHADGKAHAAGTAGANAAAHHASPPSRHHHTAVIGTHAKPRVSRPLVIGNHVSNGSNGGIEGTARNSVVSVIGPPSRSTLGAGGQPSKVILPGAGRPMQTVPGAGGPLMVGGAGGAGAGAAAGGAAGTAHRASIHRASTVAPGDRKLLRGQTIFSAAKLAQDRRTSLETCVKLLGPMVKSCAVSGKPFRAAYCSVHLVEVAETLQNSGLIALGCCQCAYSCYELDQTELGHMYAARARHIMKTEAIGDGLRAQINYQDALLHCFFGEWNEAIACLGPAKVQFKRNAEHKKWRECAFAESFVYFFLGQYESSLDVLKELGESALSDGDAYYEVSAHYWKSLNYLANDGASEDIETVLGNANTVATDVGLSASMLLSIKVLRARNDYHRTNNLLVVERLALDSLHALSSIVFLIHTCPVVVNFATLLLDACEHKDLQQTFDRWPKFKKQFMRWAQQAIEVLHKSCKILRYATGYYHLALGRYRWLEKRFQDARDLWTLAVADGRRLKMKAVEALAEFELGSHPTNTSDSAQVMREHMDRSYALCKAIRLDCRNDPHMIQIGRRAEIDPTYPKKLDKDALAMTAAAQAEIDQLAAESKRKAEDAAVGDAAAGGGAPEDEKTILARQQSLALAAALGNSPLIRPIEPTGNGNGPVFGTAINGSRNSGRGAGAAAGAADADWDEKGTPPPAASALIGMAMPSAGRHAAAVSGRKSLHAATTKRVSGDKEKTAELLRTASISDKKSGVSAMSAAMAAASVPPPAPSSGAAPSMSVTVTPPVGAQSKAKTAAGVEVLPTILASPNTSPRLGEGAKAELAAATNATDRTGSSNRTSLTAPGQAPASASPPQSGSAPHSPAPAPPLNVHAAQRAGISTSGVAPSPTSSAATDSGRGAGPTHGSGPGGPAHRSSGNAPLLTLTTSGSTNVAPNGTVSQGNSRPASPVSANAHSGNLPLFRVESLTQHNANHPLGSLPPHPSAHAAVPVSGRGTLPPLPPLS